VLIRLETGDWVDPAEVLGVEVTYSGGLEFPKLLMRGGGVMLLGEWHEGTDMGDTIARQINAALAPSGRLGPAGPDLPIGAVSTKGA
jgi:hypothetical protein